jgi:SAM-dependent methyltransferase
MKLSEYKNSLAHISYGKWLPNALYLYRDETADFEPELNKLLAQLVAVYQIGGEFNLVKFRTDELKISFLSYPDFFEVAHPVLCKAITIDLVKGKARQTDYKKNINPPILHRKETFLPADHSLWKAFRTLTSAEEAAGLYEETSTIGFKLNWERLLQEKGITIQGHSLEQRSAPDLKLVRAVPFVERHKTAMTRYDLSKPVKSLIEYGLLQPGATFFDYGCGQGSDLRGLQALGYQVDGWDPVFRPEAPKAEADVVNLGYVLNVIEDPAERLEALVEAHGRAKRLLVVSALINETVETARCAPFRDGVLTKRNTFQKFFEQAELQQYIEDALETTAVPVALGIFYVFRDPAEQQDFLSARSRRAVDWSQISARLGLGGPPATQWKTLYAANRELLDGFGNLALSLGRFPHPGEFGGEPDLVEKLGSQKRALRAFVLGSGIEGLDWPQVAERFGIGQPAKARWEILYDQHQELFDAFWKETLQLGRLPAPDEFPRFDEIAEKIGSAKKALSSFLKRGGGEALKQAEASRRNDLLVYVALANLRKQVPFGHLSGGLRRDINEFFGNYSRALQKGLDLLYAAGDPGEIELACEDLKVGWQDAQALYIHRSLLDQLPPVLRAYVGCSTALFGSVEQADLIKIHKVSGKVTFLVYDDFEGRPLPELHQRIKVNLRTRWVQVFDHKPDGQLLPFKERFVAPDHPSRLETEKFGVKLKRCGFLQGEELMVTREQFGRFLETHGLNENLNKRRH